MPRQYPPHFRREMLTPMLAGESVLSLVRATCLPEQALHRWKHQGLVNSALKKRPDSQESAKLRAANKRFKAFEKDRELVKAASALFDTKGMVHPKEDGPSQRDS